MRHLRNRTLYGCVAEDHHDHQRMSDARGEQLRAVIYVIADGDEDRWQRQCLRWCERQRYEAVSLVIDSPDGRRWRDAFEMLCKGEADVILAPNRDHLLPGRVPRAESVGEMLPARVPRQRRAREVR
jgi:hypothetical protein